MPGSHDRDIVVDGETGHVLADAAYQPVYQPGEAEHRTGLHAFDGVLANHRTWAGKFNAAQCRRACRRGIGRHLHPGRDGAAKKFTLGRYNINTDRGSKVNDDGGLPEPVIGGQTVHDAVCAHFLRVVDEQRDPGAYSGLDQHVRHRRPVLVEHYPHLVQHGRDRGQGGGTGEPLGILADQPVDRQCQFVGGDFGFGAYPPLLHDLCVLFHSGQQAHNGVGVADVNRQQHGYPTPSRGSSSSPAFSGTNAGSWPMSIGLL
ncbi:Uncharacterised protein [Mycobacterium tuberculosis]|nr:Uncharacterised protein [Mycobacterium tuberculosis]CNN56415.1 Uncharacterised protein [Mycobacterium tuberculosis]